jgi:hypothetical protein
VFWVETGQKETIERDYIQIYRLLFPEVAVRSHGSSITVEDAAPAVKIDRKDGHSWWWKVRTRSAMRRMHRTLT